MLDSFLIGTRVPSFSHPHLTLTTARSMVCTALFVGYLAPSNLLFSCRVRFFFFGTLAALVLGYTSVLDIGPL